MKRFKQTKKVERKPISAALLALVLVFCIWMTSSVMYWHLPTSFNANIFILPVFPNNIYSKNATCFSIDTILSIATDEMTSSNISLSSWNILKEEKSQKIWSQDLIPVMRTLQMEYNEADQLCNFQRCLTLWDDKLLKCYRILNLLEARVLTINSDAC